VGLVDAPKSRPVFSREIGRFQVGRRIVRKQLEPAPGEKFLDGPIFDAEYPSLFRSRDGAADFFFAGNYSAWHIFSHRDTEGTEKD
jgi:hypothetical protein